MLADSSLLADTQIVLWWQAQSDRMSTTVSAWLDRADRILVSPMTCWEIAMLVGRGRIELDRPVAAWVTDLFTDPKLVVAPITPQIAVTAGELAGFHGDPADRFIYATAVANSVRR